MRKIWFSFSVCRMRSFSARAELKDVASKIGAEVNKVVQKLESEAGVARARSVLAKLEAGRDATGGIAAGLDDLPLFAAAADIEPAHDALADTLAEIEPDTLTPREALEQIYKLKRLAAERDSG